MAVTHRQYFNLLKTKTQIHWFFRTPKLIGLAVKRLWDPLEGVAPISRRIVQDILRLTENFNTILLHEGRVV